MKKKEILALRDAAKDILGVGATSSAVATLLAALLIRDAMKKIGNTCACCRDSEC